MSETFCPLPWMHLASHPNGMVSLCCHSDHTDLTGFSHSEYPHFTKHWNLNRDEIAVIHNSESFAEARLDMLSDVQPAPCKKCFATEAKGGRSKRREEIIKWPQYNEEWAVEQTAPNGQIKADLAYVELRLGNVCNLKCITCNPISSNRWQEDYDQLADALPFVDQGMHSKNLAQETNNWTTDRRFWNDLLESTWWARKIYINGGEPTHNAEHLWYLEQLVERDLAKDVTLWYSTNMTYLPKKMLNVWSKFKKVEISASIDDLNERNDYIRYPSKWSKIEQVTTAISKMPNIDLTIVQTLSVLNFLYLKEFANWISTNGYKWSINHVTSPSFLNVNVLSQEQRILALAKLQDVLPPHIHKDLIAHYNGPASGELNKCKEYLNKLDEIRGTDINNILPRLFNE